MSNLPMIQKSLTEFVITEDEMQLVKTVEGCTRISEMGNEVKRGEVGTVAGIWRTFIGIPKTDITEELLIAMQFIEEHFSFLTIEDIKLAISMSVLRKLKDTEFSGYFSPMYIAKVLNAYVHHKNMTLASPRRRRQQDEQEEIEKRNKPTPIQQANNYRNMMQDFYEEWQRTGEIRDTFNLSYNFLRKNMILDINKELLENAQEFGKKKVAELKTKAFDNISFNFGLEEKRWARNYCVCKFFETVDIKVLCNNIKPEQFT